MTEHKYAAILRAIADGKEIQRKFDSGSWVALSPERAMEEISSRAFSPLSYRIKPETITINGNEVPKPLTKMPPTDETVFFPDFGPDADKHWVNGIDVGTHVKLLSELLQLGLLHDSHEKAAGHARALVSFTEQPCQN